MCVVCFLCPFIQFRCGFSAFVQCEWTGKLIDDSFYGVSGLSDNTLLWDSLENSCDNPMNKQQHQQQTNLIWRHLIVLASPSQNWWMTNNARKKNEKSCSLHSHDKWSFQFERNFSLTEHKLNVVESESAWRNSRWVENGEKQMDLVWQPLQLNINKWSIMNRKLNSL